MKSLFNLVDLEELWIDDNQIAEIPSEVDRLINLKRLSAYKNRLTTLPDPIFRLENLQRLNVSVNELDSLSDEIGPMQPVRLQEAAMAKSLATVPIALAALQAVLYLSIISQGVAPGCCNDSPSDYCASGTYTMGNGSKKTS